MARIQRSVTRRSLQAAETAVSVGIIRRLAIDRLRAQSRAVSEIGDRSVILDDGCIFPVEPTTNAPMVAGRVNPRLQVISGANWRDRSRATLKQVEIWTSNASMD